MNITDIKNATFLRFPIKRNRF